MRKFLINVNGTSYEVDVEEVSAGAPAPVIRSVAPAAPAPVAAAAAPAPVAPAPAAKPAPVAGGQSVKAPMPGTILDVKVKAGDTVKKGGVMLILEAMKMENEILAPQDGTVAQVLVAKGSSVNAGDALVVLA